MRMSRIIPAETAELIQRLWADGEFSRRREGLRAAELGRRRLIMQ